MWHIIDGYILCRSISFISFQKLVLLHGKEGIVILFYRWGHWVTEQLSGQHHKYGKWQSWDFNPDLTVLKACIWLCNLPYRLCFASIVETDGLFHLPHTVLSDIWTALDPPLLPKTFSPGLSGKVIPSVCFKVLFMICFSLVLILKTPSSAFLLPPAKSAAVTRVSSKFFYYLACIQTHKGFARYICTF